MKGALLQNPFTVPEVTGKKKKKAKQRKFVYPSGGVLIDQFRP